MVCIKLHYPGILLRNILQNIQNLPMTPDRQKLNYSTETSANSQKHKSVHLCHGDMKSAARAACSIVPCKFWVGAATISLRHLLEGIWKGDVVTEFKVLSPQLPRGTKENREHDQSRYPVLGSTFEPGVSWVWSWSAATFDTDHCRICY